MLDISNHESLKPTPARNAKTKPLYASNTKTIRHNHGKHELFYQYTNIHVSDDASGNVPQVREMIPRGQMIEPTCNQTIDEAGDELRTQDPIQVFV
jgi:hypothetical protein